MKLSGRHRLEDPAERTSWINPDSLPYAKPRAKLKERWFVPDSELFCDSKRKNTSLLISHFDAVNIILTLLHQAPTDEGPPLSNHAVSSGGQHILLSLVLAFPRAQGSHRVPMATRGPARPVGCRDGCQAAPTSPFTAAACRACCPRGITQLLTPEELGQGVQTRGNTGSSKMSSAL